jgi:CHAT domain-containing protein
LFELSAKQNAPSLVVLSACRTADGILADGEGIISLSRGFNAIGTSATIAGLWNVNDHAVAYITQHFYQSLLKGHTSAEALRDAKLAWIKDPQTSGALLLPYYWDSLVYMGKNQTFDLEKPFFSPWMSWSIGGLVVILLSVLTFRFLVRKTKPST